MCKLVSLISVCQSCCGYSWKLLKLETNAPGTGIIGKVVYKKESHIILSFKLSIWFYFFSLWIFISHCASCLFPSKLSFIPTFHAQIYCGVREKQVSWAKLMCTSCLCFHLPSPWTEHTHTRKVLTCQSFKSCDRRNVGELLNGCL